MTHYFQFVDTISESPNVELDLDPDTGGFWVSDATISPPELNRFTAPGIRDDYEIETGSSYASRAITLNLTMRPGTPNADQLAAIKTLVGILNRREGAWLKWQAEAAGEPTFYRTRRASPDIIDEIGDANPDRTVKLELTADPFGYGLPETGSFTITNDPTSGSNPMLAAMPDILGDVLAPLHLSLPTPDAAHRILAASQAIPSSTETLLYDDFNRPDAASVGDPVVGPSPEVRDGTAGIVNHKLRFSAGSASTYSAVWDTGSADGTFETVFTRIGNLGNSVVGAYVRSSSDENGIFVADTALYTAVSGTYTNLGSHDSPFNDGDGVRVVLAGTSIKVYRRPDNEGEWLLINSKTSSAGQTVTKHGVAAFGNSAAVLNNRWGYVKFTTPSSAQTTPYYKPLAAEFNPSTLTLLDDFNRANDAANLGGTSAVDSELDPLYTWTAGAGTWGINTNQAYVAVAAGASSLSRASIDFGVADIAIGVKISTMQADGKAGLLLRRGASSGGYAIYNNKVVDADSQATVGSAFSATFVSGDTMRVVASGNLVRVFRQAASTGAFVEVYSNTMPGTYAANTRHGLAAYGSQATTSRWDDFKYLSAVVLADWQQLDAGDATMVSGYRRRLTRNGGFDPDLAIVLDGVQQWDDLPAGDYRVMIRTAGADDGLELLFYNRPPADGVAYTRNEAAASAQVSGTVTGHDWHDLGVVAMPGGAPLADPVFGLDESTDPALWNLGVFTDENAAGVDFDAIVLIPASRPGTVTRHGSVEFSDLFTDKIVTWDGVNGRRFARGESTLAAGAVTPINPIDLTGSDLAVMPGADNVIHLFATVATGDTDRIDDSKALTTLVTWTYYPSYLYQRPDAG